MKTGKDDGPSEISLELIAASRGVGIQVMVKMSVTYRLGMPEV